MKNFYLKNIYSLVVINLILILTVYYLKIYFLMGAIFFFPIYLAIYLFGIGIFIKNIKERKDWVIILSVTLGIIALFIHGYLQGVIVDYADFNRTLPNYIAVFSSVVGILMWSLPLSVIIFNSKQRIA